MKYYTKGGQSQKSYDHICNQKLDKVVEFIDNNKNIYQHNQNYIIIAKKQTLDLTYQELEKELIYLFNKIKGE